YVRAVFLEGQAQHQDVGLRGLQVALGHQLGSASCDMAAHAVVDPAAGEDYVRVVADLLGLAFKENCPDVRNTRVVDIVAELRSYNANVHIHDPWVDAGEAKHEYGLDLVDKPEAGKYDAIILAVSHREFIALGVEGIRAFGKPGAVLFDVKRALPRAGVDDCL
ncbi:MAG: Vi polysaccharide biosynthesis UDP-N-acetylglucosamine C-6 dehydrogenase TviB, partial [Rubrivivax sp.]